MALRTIVQDGDPILKKVCRPVTKFDDRLGTLLDDMKETLLAANGLGLAGPQVGMMRRLFICLDDRDLVDGAAAEAGIVGVCVVLRERRAIAEPAPVRFCCRLS